MGTLIDFNLHRLGWHGFQQLCQTVAREVWGQTVEAFLDVNDGGQDGAFTGSWNEHDGVLAGQFVIQCKHTSRPGASLSVAELREDLAKAARLVESRRCDVYILMTNAGVSGRIKEKLEASFKAVGVKEFRCYGSTWINGILTESKRLRMLVPRVYGLGDLTQILDERSYAQAQRVLESMRSDLARIVRTGTYDRAARALHDHGFVLLVGEPATGKTTIAAQLTLGAVDVWGCSAIKLDDPADFRDRWNPDEPRQLFWVDDVFGSTQLDTGLAHKWTRAVPLIQAALKHGARVVVTSRDYIYRAARPHLKPGTFPLLEESKVVVDVRELTPTERRQILYNHLKHGSQSRVFLSDIGKYLEDLSDHPGFTPELARRLALPAFTKRLEPPVGFGQLDAFFTNPTTFLAEVIEGLDDSSKAALGLVYVHHGFLPSPLPLHNLNRELAMRLGSDLASVTRALGVMEGSFVSHTSSDEGQPGWAFSHPSLLDAYAELLRTPELTHLLAAGFPLSILISETTCGFVGVSHAIVFPRSMYTLILDRFDEPLPVETQARWRAHTGRMRYLAFRCDREFLQCYLARHPELYDRISNVGLMLDAHAEVEVAVRLHSMGLLPEKSRAPLAARASEYFVKGEDPGLLSIRDFRTLLSTEEAAEVRNRIVHELAPRLDEVVEEWKDNYDSEYGPPEDYYRPLIELLEATEKELADEQVLLPLCRRTLSELQTYVRNQDPSEGYQWVNREYLGSSSSPEKRQRVRPTAGTRSIFDDLLD
jgi:hypothetical protein